MWNRSLKEMARSSLLAIVNRRYHFPFFFNKIVVSGSPCRTTINPQYSLQQVTSTSVWTSGQLAHTYLSRRTTLSLAVIRTIDLQLLLLYLKHSTIFLRRYYFPLKQGPLKWRQMHLQTEQLTL